MFIKKRKEKKERKRERKEKVLHLFICKTFALLMKPIFRGYLTRTKRISFKYNDGPNDLFTSFLSSCRFN